jgi:hypothetical protein
MKPSSRLLSALLLLTPPALAQEAATPSAQAEPAPAAPASPGATAAPPGAEAEAKVEQTGKIESASEQAQLKTEKREAKGPEGEDEAEEARRDDRESGEDDTYGHGMQVGIRGGFVLGYKMSFRYDNSPFCTRPDPEKADNKEQKVCGFGAPPAAEVALSFAPFDSVEPYVFGRFGLSGEAETNTRPLKLFGVGARIYTNADSRFKIFVEPALAYEFEVGSGNPEWNPTVGTYRTEYKKDMVFHVGIGPQYDFAKAFGLFLNLGIDVGVLRSISATLLGNIGAQIRFP